ncbi:MAG: NAD(P)H-binding protein, partial [Solirubrobacterales bacterium]|nr:NAD(P)H-binding protein [Solirubrobacterales bacterium]
MRILIVGATGALGRDLVEAALKDGHDTAALVRDPASAELPEAVELVAGDVLDRSSLRAAVDGREAVICALGTPSPRRASTLLQEGTRNLVFAMDQAGVRRLVCVTLLGMGTSRANASLTYRQVILRGLAPMLADKQAQEDVVRASELDWTLVRPPRFIGGKSGAELRVIAEGQPGRVGHIVRADLAGFLLHCATEDRHVREAVAVGSSPAAPESMKLRPRAAVLLSGLLTGSELTSWGIVHPTLWKLEHREQVRAEKLVYRRFGTVDPLLQTATIAACFATAQGLRGPSR